MPIDFFAPGFSVVVNGKKLAADILKYITQVRVTSEPDKPDQFSLTLANPFPELRWTHDEGDVKLFQEGSTVEIQMDYVDHTRVMFDGEITRISPTFPESGTPTVSVEGADRMHRLKSSVNTRTFHNVTDKEIAQTIANDLNLELDADETEGPHAYMIQYNQTDLAFLLQRARSIHFEMKVDGKKLIFKKSQDTQTKNYTLVWGLPQKSVAPDQQRMPLKSFHATMNTLRQVYEVIVRGYDAKQKKSIEARAGPGAEESKKGDKTGAAAAAEALDRRREEIQVKTPIASQQEADALAKALYNKQALEFVTGTGTTIGLPDLQAGTVIELAGLGPVFSGEYFVTQTTHTIGGGGYQTSFTARKNSKG